MVKKYPVHIGVIYKDEKGKMVIENLSAFAKNHETDEGLYTETYDLENYKDLHENEYHVSMFVLKDDVVHIVKLVESFISTKVYDALENYPKEFEDDLYRCILSLHGKEDEMVLH